MKVPNWWVNPPAYPFWLAFVMGIAGMADGLLYALSFGRICTSWQFDLMSWELKKQFKKAQQKQNNNTQ